MFNLPTQSSSIVLEIANVRTAIRMKLEDDETELEEISDDVNEDSGSPPYHPILKKMIGTTSRPYYI
jgi:hypothetical protein